MIEITRRHVISASIGQFLYWCSALPSLAQRAVRENGAGPQRLNWNAFVDRLESTARVQHKPAWDQAQYTQRIAALARSLNLPDKRLTDERAAYRNIHPFRPEFQDLLQTADIQISLISFERGESIPHHDHPDMTGVMVCAMGDVMVSEYDISPAVRYGGWLLNLAGQERLEPGLTSTLTARTRNVHTLRAAAFSQIIDIFTPPYNDERKKRTRWFRIEPLPGPMRGRTFLAHDVEAR